MFCVNITDLRSLAFALAELNHFPHNPKKDRNRWKEMVLLVHDTTATTKSQATTC